MKVKVSIIIPTYNRSGLLKKTLNSVAEQDFKDWECIIVDDGSEDNTAEIVINEFVKADSRFIYHKRPEDTPKGASECRNFGLTKSKGNFIQWLDDDDLLSKNKLKRQYNVLRKKSPFKIAICDWDHFWTGKILELQNSFGDYREIEVKEYYNFLYTKQSFVPLHAFLLSKSICLKAGAWNKDLTVNDDAEYINRVLLNCNGILNISECHVLYRNHSDRRYSRENNLESHLESLDLMNSQLSKTDFIVHDYFKWKLLQIFNKYYSTEKDLIVQYSHLFHKYGIDLKYAWIFRIKYLLYLNFYPIYKQFRKIDI